MTNQINQSIDSREFGKDITNAFIGIRPSLDHSLQLGISYKNQKQPTGKIVKPMQSTGFQSLNMVNMKKNPNQIGFVKKSSYQSYTQNDSHVMEIDVNPFTFNKNKECNSYRDNREDERKNDKSDYISSSSCGTNHVNMKYNQNTSFAFGTVNEKSDHIEYIDSIFTYLKQFENENQYLYTRRNYMKESQYDINEKMRAILLDWLVEVHLKFKLQQETFFLTINLIDRYLERRTIQRTKLQLVGITAMFIACKYEEIYAPEVKDFVFITDKAYTNEEVLLMESDILSSVSFNVTVPSSLRFIELYNFYIGFDETVFCFMLYLLDLSVVDYRMIKYKSSLIAASVVYVSMKLLHKENIVRNTKIEDDIIWLYRLSEYSEEEIKVCAKDVCLIYDYSDKTGLAAVKKKYSLIKYKEVARIKFGGK